MPSIDALPSQSGIMVPPSIRWDASRIAHPGSPPCVSLPFTAPMLTAMRVRVAHGGGIEMLLANPAGGRGIYVAAWPVLRAFAEPSIHDIMLADQIGASSGPAQPSCRALPLCPAGIRSASIEIAARGHAGRKLARAAERARDAEKLGERRVRAHLLLDLARALDLPGSASTLNDPWSIQPDEHTGWLAGAPRVLAHRLAWPVPWRSSELSTSIAQIAKLVWPLGIGPAAEQARLPRVLRLMSERALALRGGATSSIEIRLDEAAAALQRARAMLADPLALLSGWRADHASVTQILERPDWLLDGWDRLCLLSRTGTEVGQLAQILLYDGDSPIALSRVECYGTDTLGRAGIAASFDRQARNEALRLHELELMDPETDDAERGGVDG